MLRRTRAEGLWLGGERNKQTRACVCVHQAFRSCSAQGIRSGNPEGSRKGDSLVLFILGPHVCVIPFQNPKPISTCSILVTQRSA